MPGAVNPGEKKADKTMDSNKRYRLFGMAGSWEEYWIFADKKEELYPEAKFHLRYGHDAWIEDSETGEVYKLSFKK